MSGSTVLQVTLVWPHLLPLLPGRGRHLHCCKDIILRRSTSGSLGFSIVGGLEEVNCNQSFFIRSIVEGTPAYNDGRIR